MAKPAPHITRRVTLAELCDLITDGKHGDCTPDKTSGYYFLSCKDVRDGKLSYDGARQITAADFVETHRRTRLEPGDILITNSGTIGRMAIAPDVALTRRTTFQKSVAIVKADVKKVDGRWLYYYLLAEMDRLSGVAGGTAQKNLLLRDMRGFQIELPDRQTQRRIASILAAYDDLIETNRRRMALLEQAARLLYREWFVHLHFPGHDHVRVVDGVPEGWERKRIDEVAETVGGGTPSTVVSDYWDGDITWVVPSDVTKNDGIVLLDSERKITEKGLRESSARLVPANTILMTSRASVGFFALMDREVCTNQGFINVIPHEGALRMYLLFNLMYRVDEIRSNAKGSTYPEINKSTFRGLSVIVPPIEICREFAAVIGPMIGQIRNIKKQVVNLAQARDLLLPRLMSGEIVV